MKVIKKNYVEILNFNVKYYIVTDDLLKYILIFIIDAIDLLKLLLTYDHTKRPMIESIISHPYII